jgi:hypothetical protein
MLSQEEVREYSDGLLEVVAARVSEMSDKEARLFAINLIQGYKSDYPPKILRDLKRLVTKGRSLGSMYWISRSELGQRLLIQDAKESTYMVFHQMIVYVKAVDYVRFYLAIPVK